MQFDEFLAAIQKGREPYSGIDQGREVVRVLEAAQRSLENGGAPESLYLKTGGMATRRRVLIVTEDPVGEVLGGAAIRAYEIARALTDVADVTLAAPGTEPPGLAPAKHVPFQIAHPEPLRALFKAADVVIMRPPNPLVAGWLRRAQARIT